MIEDTNRVISARKLRRVLGLERGERLGRRPIATHDGEWRLNSDGSWTFLEHEDVRAERLGDD